LPAAAALKPNPFPNPKTVFWGGYPSSFVVSDKDTRATYADTMSRMAAATMGDMRAFTILMAA
jgi:hypothetical protein